MPAGRKEKYLDLEQVEMLASRGLTEKQIAAALGVCQETLIRRKRKYANFVEVLKRGQAKGIAKVSNALFEQATSGQVVAAIFYLKNRAGWKDVHDTNLRHSVEPLSETDKWLEDLVGGGKKTEDS